VWVWIVSCLRNRLYLLFLAAKNEAARIRVEIHWFTRFTAEVGGQGQWEWVGLGGGTPTRCLPRMFRLLFLLLLLVAEAPTTWRPSCDQTELYAESSFTSVQAAAFGDVSDKAC
jgi:hypothetical protein